MTKRKARQLGLISNDLTCRRIACSSCPEKMLTIARTQWEWGLRSSSLEGGLHPFLQLSSWVLCPAIGSDPGTSRQVSGAVRVRRCTIRAVGEAEHVRVEIVAAEGMPQYATAGLSSGPPRYLTNSHQVQSRIPCNEKLSGPDPCGKGTSRRAASTVAPSNPSLRSPNAPPPPAETAKCEL
jgi:hypothetical protein